MAHQIKTVYVIHHSHTDIGYTDLQEWVIQNQADYIRRVLSIFEKPENADFRWNCETLFCVEEFFKTASDGEKEAFCRLAAQGKIGLSANYLNFTDLVDCGIFEDRLRRWQDYFREKGCAMKTAMMADINGISMGYRDAMLDNGVEFLFTNIHCHHGMYPLHQNQNAYWWENAAGKRLLVWNGEHYNLGNVLGILPSKRTNFMIEDYLGDDRILPDPVEALHRNLEDYLGLCEANNYAYDFLLTSVSGVWCDNAPPEAEILHLIQEYNRRYGQDCRLLMVSLPEVYAAIAGKLQDAPVYHGDLTDWWANGVGSTPYAAKHYKEAQRRYQLCKRLDPDLERHYPDLVRTAQDGLLLYAEHTWGHSDTINSPCHTMVLNLDMRKAGYASKAHEAASTMLHSIIRQKGDILRYYNPCGTIRVCSVSRTDAPQLAEFYIEGEEIDAVEIQDEHGRVIPCQVSPHPRGRKIGFMDVLAPFEERTYTYRKIPRQSTPRNVRQCYEGAESVRDIVNDYDTETYRLPYGFENDWFSLSYRPHEGITSFVEKRTGRELLGEGAAPFFTPLYERTAIRSGEYEERRRLGRNIRGQHAQLYAGQLEEVTCVERGPVFTELCLRYSLPGTVRAHMYLRFYAAAPRIDFRLELGKTLSSDIESVFLPLTLSLPDRTVCLRKGAEAFRPGVDQIPGTCMEYYMSDHGVALLSPAGSALIAARDTPLVYMGEMRHHPIQLCDNKEENNLRPLYAWIMNNTWETNFKMDLSGYCEFHYTLWMTDAQAPEEAMDALRERTFDPYVLIVK